MGAVGEALSESKIEREIELYQTLVLIHGNHRSLFCFSFLYQTSFKVAGRTVEVALMKP